MIGFLLVMASTLSNACVNHSHTITPKQPDTLCHKINEQQVNQATQNKLRAVIEVTSFNPGKKNPAASFIASYTNKNNQDIVLTRFGIYPGSSYSKSEPSQFFDIPLTSIYSELPGINSICINLALAGVDSKASVELHLKILE